MGRRHLAEAQHSDENERDDEPPLRHPAEPVSQVRSGRHVIVRFVRTSVDWHIPSLGTPARSGVAKTGDPRERRAADIRTHSLSRSGVGVISLIRIQTPFAANHKG